jgi:hypothetical protein
LQKYINVVVTCPTIAIASARADDRDARSTPSRVDDVAREPPQLLRRHEPQETAEPARLEQQQHTGDHRGGERHLHRADHLAERLALRDAAGERHEHEDHGEEADEADQALDRERGRAFDRLPREADRLVEPPGVEPHRARRDDAEVAADEVRVREIAEPEVDALAAAGSASARRSRRCRRASRASAAMNQGTKIQGSRPRIVAHSSENSAGTS